MEHGWTATIEREVEQDYEVEFDASDTADAYTEAIYQTYEQHNVRIPLHVWENGFEQGDASDEEVSEFAKKIAGGNIAKVYDTLNSTLRSIYKQKLIRLAKAQ